MAQELTVDKFINNEVVKKCLKDLKETFPPDGKSLIVSDVLDNEVVFLKFNFLIIILNLQLCQTLTSLLTSTAIPITLLLQELMRLMDSRLCRKATQPAIVPVYGIMIPPVDR